VNTVDKKSYQIVCPECPGLPGQLMEGGNKLFLATPEGQKAAIADCQLAQELLGEWPSPLSVAVVDARTEKILGFI
jgi:hypothetical protein